MTEEMIQPIVSDLHYFRCSDCLGAFTVKEGDLPGKAWACQGSCVCGGSISYIGRVHESHYEKDGLKSACDKRCTDASGPVCNCHCGCKNHGTGKLVSVVVEEGKVRVTTFDQKLIDRGNEWRAMIKQLQDEYHRVWGDVETAVMAYRSTWTQANQLRPFQMDLRRVSLMKLYSQRKKRVQGMIDILKSLTPVPVETKPN
jgi:hypothetical protein